jgi:hypothetical protein
MQILFEFCSTHCIINNYFFSLILKIIIKVQVIVGLNQQLLIGQGKIQYDGCL